MLATTQKTSEEPAHGDRARSNGYRQCRSAIGGGARNCLRFEDSVYEVAYKQLTGKPLTSEGGVVERHEAGATTRIVKVKAHADVYGNEQADKHAKAATQMTSENATTINDPVDSTNIGFTWNKKPSGDEEEGTPLRLKEHVKFVLENEAIKT